MRFRTWAFLAAFVLLVLPTALPAEAGEFTAAYSIAARGTDFGAMNGALGINWPDPTLAEANTIEVRYSTAKTSPWVWGLMYEDLVFSSTQVVDDSESGAGIRWLRRGYVKTYGASLAGYLRRGRTIQPFARGSVGVITVERRYHVTDLPTGAVLEDYSKDPVTGGYGRIAAGADFYLVPRHFFVSPFVEFEGDFRYRLGAGIAF